MPAILARFGIIRFVAFLLTTGVKTVVAHLVRLISRGSPAESATVSSPWFAALPPDEKAMASIFWIQPKFALTIASQLENLPVSAASLGRFTNFCDKPVIILPGRTAPERRRAEHAEIAARLPQGEHILAGSSNHWIMQEDPELILRAIKKVVQSSGKRMAQAAASPISDRI